MYHSFSCVGGRGYTYSVMTVCLGMTVCLHIPCMCIGLSLLCACICLCTVLSLLCAFICLCNRLSPLHALLSCAVVPPRTPQRCIACAGGHSRVTGSPATLHCTVYPCAFATTSYPCMLAFSCACICLCNSLSALHACFCLCNGLSPLHACIACTNMLLSSVPDHDLVRGHLQHFSGSCSHQYCTNEWFVYRV